MKSLISKLNFSLKVKLRFIVIHRGIFNISLLKFVSLIVLKFEYYHFTDIAF